jgi:hypothetical protein
MPAEQRRKTAQRGRDVAPRLADDCWATLRHTVGSGGAGYHLPKLEPPADFALFVSDVARLAR